MNALFVHDHIFYQIKDAFYSSGGLPASTWERYLAHFNQLTVISRGIQGKCLSKGLILSSHSNVIFDPLYEVKGSYDYYKYRYLIKKKIINDIYNYNVDVIIIRLPSTIGYFAADLCRQKHIHYVVEVVGCAWDASWNYGKLMMKLMTPYTYFKMRQSVKGSIAAIYVTKYFLQKRYPNSGIQEYASNVQIESVSEDVLFNHLDFLNRTHEFFKIGMIGNLSIKYKGYDVAIRSLSKLKKRGINFKFYLVGSGNNDYVNKLIQKFGLQQETVIVGTLKAGDQILKFLDELDLYIHPSKQEGLPRSVIEAMSRGCPILASNVAGIPELLEDKYMHNPGDYNRLCLQLFDILGNRQELLEMAKQNFNKSSEYYIEILKSRRDIFFNNVKEYVKNRL
jgi:glycosyltransferase involved in cell wall biosynthesis